MTVQLERVGLEPKSFYRRMEALLDSIPAEASPLRFAQAFAAGLLRGFGNDLALVSWQLYQERNSHFCRFERGGGEATDLSDELDRRFTDPLTNGVGELPWSGDTEAGLTGLVGIPGKERLVLALHFGDRPGGSPHAVRIQSVVSPLHYAIAQHLRRRELEDILEQSRAIQLSLLPARAPVFGDFDIAAASRPAQRVGGDFYDFLSVDADTLAITVADAAGHGLPAALQARDVATGLRMGVERDLKITRTVEKLSRVIHRSGLASRFVSLMVGELERNGNLTYVNAGHPPALLLDDRGVHELTVGGTLLGMDSEATYKLGFAHVDRGASLVLYTDGVTERGSEEGAQFGTERLSAWLRDWRDGPSCQAVDDLLERLTTFGAGRPFEDDVTILHLRRPR